VHDNPLLAAAFIFSTENLSTIIIIAFKLFIDFLYPLAGFAALALSTACSLQLQRKCYYYKIDSVGSLKDLAISNRCMQRRTTRMSLSITTFFYIVVLSSAVKGNSPRFSIFLPILQDISRAASVGPNPSTTYRNASIPSI
jgi:hypothetical protein